MAIAAGTTTDARERSRPMTREEKKVIAASSAGTIFEWYDFYLYGALAAIIGAQFFTAFPENTRNVFALLAFAAGFIVRPFGALVFGMLGDMIGRKYTFLMTIVIMGISTFLVGILPNYESWGVAAPVLLILLLAISFIHMHAGMRVIVEDYIHKTLSKSALLLLNLAVCVVFGALAVFSILKVALGGGVF